MWQIPLFDLRLAEQEFEAVQAVLRSGWLTMGRVTEQFEQAFAEFIGTKYAFAVSNGTAALHLANLVVGIGAGDEVICPALTFITGANAILYTGAQPVFADITGVDDFNISPDDIEAHITERTKAIEIVHYGGYPCAMERITDIADRYNLFLIEDCAHAPGAEYGGKKCGNLGDIGCFSFFSNKNMTTAEGGMITTNNDELAEKIRLMRSHGMTSQTLDRHYGRAFSYNVVELGYNYRIDEIRSALGIVQLEKLRDSEQSRRQLTEYYEHRLNAIRGLTTPFQQTPGTSSYHIFPILLDDHVDRQEFMTFLKSKGIQTSIHYPPIHLFSYYQQHFGYSKNFLPVTETVAAREVTLPLYPGLTFEQIDYIVETIETAIRA